MTVELDALNSRERARRLARDFAGIESGLVKMTVTTNAIAAVERAVELIGNPGLSRANQIERHLRDVLCSRIHTPQNDSILLAAGRAAFKAPDERGERP